MAGGHLGTAGDLPAGDPYGPGLPDWMRVGHLLPFLAAELSGHLGVRLRLRVEDGDHGSIDPVPLGSVNTADGRLLLALDTDAATELLAAVCGSDRATSLPETLLLTDLAPDSAGWVALATLTRHAVARALARAGAGDAVAEAPRLADAGSFLDSSQGIRAIILTLHGAGLQAVMGLRFVAMPTTAGIKGALDDRGPPAVAAAASALPWARRMDAASRRVPVPVTLELAAREMALRDVVQLGVGDVIPLPPVHTLKLRVAGAEWADVPMATLRSPDAGLAGAPPGNAGLDEEGRA